MKLRDIKRWKIQEKRLSMENTVRMPNIIRMRMREREREIENGGTEVIFEEIMAEDFQN